MVIEEGQLKGKFEGFRDHNTFFEFFGSTKWHQAEYKYYYHYAYMPRAKVIQEAGRYMLYVDGIREPVQVRPR